MMQILRPRQNFKNFLFIPLDFCCAFWSLHSLDALAQDFHSSFGVFVSHHSGEDK
jgi:hypothetical protein